MKKMKQTGLVCLLIGFFTVFLVGCEDGGIFDLGKTKVVTNSATDIKPYSATLTGTATGGDYTVTERGMIWGLSNEPRFEGSNYKGYRSLGQGTGDINVTVSYLNNNTTYFARAYAEISTEEGYEIIYGNQIQFKTLSGDATLSTSSVTGIYDSRATVGGNITNDGTLAITERGVIWGLNPEPRFNSQYRSYKNMGQGVGIFSGEISYLESNTTYYVCAYCVNSAGTFYGNDVKFTTLPREN